LGKSDSVSAAFLFHFSIFALAGRSSLQSDFVSSSRLLLLIK